MRFLCSVLALVGMIGAAFAQSVAPISNATSIANGSTTARTFSDRFAQQINVKDYGAICNWNGTTGHDDSGAFSAAIAEINTLASSGTNVVLYVPAGSCYVNAAITQFAEHVPGAVVGDGPLKSFITAGVNLTGSLFSWDEAWGLTNPYTGSYPTTTAWNGPLVQDISLNASTTSTHQQNALTFLDRNDYVLVQNVDIMYFTGYAISIGAQNLQPVSYMRESHFYNVRVISSGAPTIPCIWIGATGTGDSTNDDDFHELNIIQCNGPGLVINNANTVKSVSQLHFYGLRIEGSVGNQLTLGDPALTGQVSGITIYGLQIEAGKTGYDDVLMESPSLSNAPANIFADGAIAASNANNLVISSASNVSFRVLLGTSATNVIVASSTTVAGPIYLDGNGTEYQWSTSIDATSLPNIRIPGLRYGNPSTQTNVLANTHDGSPGRGNAPGLGANDLQSYRTAAAQTASGDYSTISGGKQNTASQVDTTISGGEFNTASGFRSTISGGYIGSAPGAYTSIIGGTGCLTIGNYSSCLGGQNATDRTDTSLIWSLGSFSVRGDQQRREALLSSALASTSPVQLTTNGLTPTLFNGVSIPVGTVYKTAVETSCRDTVTPANWATWNMQEGVLQRQSGSPSYAGGAISAITPSQSGGTAGSATLAISADGTNDVLGVTITWPNANVTHCNSYVKTIEVQ